MHACITHTHTHTHTHIHSITITNWKPLSLGKTVTHKTAARPHEERASYRPTHDAHSLGCLPSSMLMHSTSKMYAVREPVPLQVMLCHIVM